MEFGDSTVTASDAIAEARGFLGEYYTTGNFSDTQMLAWCDRAQKEVVKKTRWPEALQAFSTQPLVQEYPLEEVIRCLRVYVAGQIIIRKDIPTMEGRQIEYYDQSAQGQGPAGVYQFGSPPVNTTGQNVPQWTAMPTSGYPVNSPIGGAANFAGAAYPGQRPTYYFRGGIIGFVPIPVGAYPVQVNCVKVPPKVTQMTDQLLVGDQGLLAVAWLMCYFAYFQDRDNDGSQQLRAEAQQNYREQLQDIWRFTKRYAGDGPNGPRPRTGRYGYGRYNNGWGY